MAISTPKAELGGTLVDCLLYGLYLSILFQAVQVLAKRRTRTKTWAYLAATTASLFCLITAHLGLDIDRTFRAFTDGTAIPRYPEGYFNVLAGAEALAKNSSYVTATLIADSFLIFRCFIALGNNYLVIALPLLLYIGNLVTACLALITFRKAGDPTSGKAVVAEVISRVKYMYVCTLALNVWCTVSIAGRIWIAQRGTISDKSGKRLLTNTMQIIVESAAIYSAFLIILITSASLQSAMMYAVLNPMPSIIGVVFSLIIVRVGSGRSFSTQGANVRSRLEFRATQAHTQPTTSVHSASILPTHVTFDNTAGGQRDPKSMENSAA